MNPNVCLRCDAPVETVDGRGLKGFFLYAEAGGGSIYDYPVKEPTPAGILSAAPTIEAVLCERCYEKTAATHFVGWKTVMTKRREAVFGELRGSP